MMAHSETEDSRSGLRAFLRQAPSFDIEVGQLSGASESLAHHWPKWKSESDQESWDPFYLKTVEGLLDCESGKTQRCPARLKYLIEWLKSVSCRLSTTASSGRNQKPFR